MRKNTKRGLTSLLVVSMLVVALVSGLALALEEEPAAEVVLAADTTTAEPTSEDESANQPGICPVTGEPALNEGEVYQRHQRFGMQEGAKGEGVGDQLRQQVQTKDGACLDNPELMAERQAEREARQVERGERQQVQTKDGACLDNPELIAERQAERESRQAERGERQQGRGGRMTQNRTADNTPDA